MACWVCDRETELVLTRPFRTCASCLTRLALLSLMPNDPFALDFWKVVPTSGTPQRSSSAHSLPTWAGQRSRRDLAVTYFEAGSDADALACAASVVLEGPDVGRDAEMGTILLKCMKSESRPAVRRWMRSRLGVA